MIDTLRKYFWLHRCRYCSDWVAIDAAIITRAAWRFLCFSTLLANKSSWCPKAKNNLEQTGKPFCGIVLNKLNTSWKYGSYGAYGTMGIMAKIINSLEDIGEEKGIEDHLGDNPEFSCHFISYLLSFVTEIVNTCYYLVYLFIFLFFITVIRHDFFKRGLFSRVYQHCKVHCVFYLAISTEFFFLEDRFSICDCRDDLLLTIHSYSVVFVESVH